MKYYYCYECEEFFTEEEAGHRAAQLEDAMPPGTQVMCCPSCGSSEITEAEVCRKCGKPIFGRSVEFCEDCEREMDDVIGDLLCTMDADYDDAIYAFAEYMERKWL